MVSPVNQDRVNEVASDLQGTCKSLDDFATPEEANDVDFCRAIDDIVFCCDECGWWCDVGEQSHDKGEVCTDCNPDSEDD